jgi:hypothetical protein
MELFFYNTTPEPLMRLARSRAVAEPSGAFGKPIHVTEQRFGSVRRSYIECLRDQAIPIASQRLMRQATPVSAAESLNSDHAPFLSVPMELVQALERLRSAT